MTKIIKRALISVTNKKGLVELGSFLHERHVEILASGGTYKFLTEQGIPAIEISEYTQFPEILGGRVKTLNPLIYGAILHRGEQDTQVLKDFDMTPIDLVVVNLYSFEQTIKNSDDFAEAIEQIDIGGPCLIRAAAKNHKEVCVLTDPNDYLDFISEYRKNDNTNFQYRLSLASKAFSLITQYDNVISNYFQTKLTSPNQKADYTSKFLGTHSITSTKVAELRYGENAHQEAALYAYDATKQSGNIINSKQIQGKELSFNNIVDADAALSCVKEFSDTCCVIVKHANPCGVALGENNLVAYNKAYTCDPVSAFGGIIAFNKEVDVEVTKEILNKQFVEIVVAPSFTPEAILAFTKKPNVRVLEVGELEPNVDLNIKSIEGGYLLQTPDEEVTDLAKAIYPTAKKASAEQIADFDFAVKVCKYVKSNAIVLVKDNQTIGIGAGQPNRYHSTKIACEKALEQGFSLEHSVLASDAFFPFRDGIDFAASFGVKAIIQPGGSIRDTEVISAADEHDMVMALTSIRHFRH